MKISLPNNPFVILDPYSRWAPSQEELSHKAYETLLPPLVHKIRLAVKEWRDKNYEGASDTSKSLLNYWFNTEHKNNGNVFQYYFCQREAMESIVYLYEVAKARDKYELMRFDSSGRVSTGHFQENWCRYVIKMATGSGKTKVISLAIVWSYFNKLYEQNSFLSKNFLLIAPNIIVLNRLLNDFKDLKIFKTDPLIPADGYMDKNWSSDFQIALHVQDELGAISPYGNIFLTNIHRVFITNDVKLTPDEEFLGKKPPSDADRNKGLDLGKLLRSDAIQDLVVLNDEAHHIHDEDMAWFKSIEDINNKLKLKYEKSIALQIDCTATPRHQKGAIFVQTICDYPLVEAIKQRIVKSPVLPDEPSRAKLQEHSSDKFVEKYKDYIDLGYKEWQKQYKELKHSKIPILFIMTNVTKEADETKEYLENFYPEFKDKVLVIHTNKQGEVSESNTVSKANKDQLEKLRKAANDVDREFSPYRAICSVMMLKEGWDVKNVTTVIGLRPYTAKSNILPEQTLGRGLRKMYDLKTYEELVVVGTPAFIEFVESIKSEGVEFGYRKMGENAATKTPLIIEPDVDNPHKNIDELDIKIPILTARIYKEYKNIDKVNTKQFEFSPITLKQFNANELREIIFTDLEGKFSHKLVLDNVSPDYRSAVSFFTKTILRECRLFTGFEILFPKVEQFIRFQLFGKEVNLSDPNILRNLSEVVAKDTIIKTFKNAIDTLTIEDKGTAEVKNYIKLRDAKPMAVTNNKCIIPKKSVFNKIVGDNDFELEFAAFLENCSDIISYAKNTYNVCFRIEYQGHDGNIHDFHPDFLVKQNNKMTYIVETKGREDGDDKRKIDRLVTWCKDIDSIKTGEDYKPLYVKQEVWDKYKTQIKNFSDLIGLFNVK